MSRRKTVAVASLVETLNRYETIRAGGGDIDLESVRVLVSGVLMDTGNYGGYRLDVETGERTYMVKG